MEDEQQAPEESGKTSFEFEKALTPERQSPAVVRELREADMESLRPILAQWIRDRDSGEVLEDEITSVLEAMRASTTGHNGRLYLVAEGAEGQMAGVMGMAEPGSDMRAFATTERPIEFINAYIDQEQRGKGVGRQLAEGLEARAVAAGHTEIIVNSGPRYQESGWAFWTKLYGEPADLQKDYYGVGGDAPVWRKALPTNPN